MGRGRDEVEHGDEIYRKFSTGVQSRNHSTVTYRRFKNFDPTKFRNDICSQDWNSVKMFDNPNDM